MAVIIAPKTAYRVSDLELASRLSYFLWGSMPDDQLFAAAQAGTLHEPATLRAQFSRMVADAKIKRFTDYYDLASFFR